LEALDNSDGFIMLNAIQKFDYLFHLTIMTEIYLITNILSKYLQHSDISLTTALIQVNITIETLKTLRTDLKFEEFWSKTIDICKVNDIDEPRETRKRRIPAKLGAGSIIPDHFSTKDIYRVNSYYAVLDHIVMAIENRFDENHCGIIVLCEKLFLTKDYLSSDELQQLAASHELNYEELRGEHSLYKTAMVNRHEATLKSVTRFFCSRISIWLYFR